MSVTATRPAESAASPLSRRSAGLDALRGVAVALMVLDHLLLWFLPAGQPVRETLTRASMPLFALLAGHLARRVSWRLALVFGWGLVLSVVAPWAGNPNILLQLGVGLVLLWAVRLPGLPAAPLLLAGAAWPLLLGANGYLPAPGAAYPLAAVVGLVFLGALAPRPSLAFLEGLRLPLLARVGRCPLTVYVGHVLLLTLLGPVLRG